MEEKRKHETREQKLDKRLESEGGKDAVRNMAMPQQSREALTEQLKACQCPQNRKTGNLMLRRGRFAGLAAAAACMLLVLTMTGMTAHAVYVNKHLNVFFEKDITAEQMSRIETQLLQMDGVVSCRYIDSDTAWKTFGETYLTPELMEGFTENPLADSANFRIGVALNVDAEQMKALIEELDGVRIVSGLWEE